MDKFLHSRLFRCLVCLLLICCILVNCSPIQAKASLAIAALTAPQVAGLITCIVGTVVGNIILVESLAELAAVGNVIYTPGITDDDQILVDDLTSYTSNLNNHWNGDGGDSDPGLNLDEEFILGAAAAVLYDSIVNGRLEAEVEEEVEVDVPEEILSCPIQIIFDNYVYGVQSVVSVYPYYEPNDEFKNVSIEYTGPGYYSVYSTSTGKWSSPSTVSSGTRYLRNGFLRWSNVDILGTSGQSTFVGTPIITSDYSTTEKKTITIDPLYVGDLPTQIENGDLDEEESKEKILAPLPDYIDITKVIKSPETAVEDLTQWQQQVVDNQKTLEEALEDITGELEDIGDDLETLPTSPTPEEPDPWVPSGMENFTLDLKKFFPFCIPFDLYAFLTCLNAEPEAPVISWQVLTPGGSPYLLEIDLSAFDSVAQLLRRLQLLVFCIGLAFKTRDLIKG